MGEAFPLTARKALYWMNSRGSSGEFILRGIAPPTMLLGAPRFFLSQESKKINFSMRRAQRASFLLLLWRANNFASASLPMRSGPTVTSCVKHVKLFLSFHFWQVVRRKTREKKRKRQRDICGFYYNHESCGAKERLLLFSEGVSWLLSFVSECE